MLDTLRLGSVRFSNVAPLARGLPQEQVRYGSPVEVASWLADGEVDVGLVPVIEVGRTPGLTVLPGLGIAADGRCDSVFLFGRGSLASMRSVSLDADSRSSSALTRILLERESPEQVEFVEVQGGSVAERLEDHDGTVLIGDPALSASLPSGVSRWDLAAEWKRHVGLPFVFAVWASRPGLVLSTEQLASFDAAAADGLSRIAELAEAEAERTGIAAGVLRDYFELLDYRLGPEHRRGLEAFLSEAARVGVLGPEDEGRLEFYPEVS